MIAVGFFHLMHDALMSRSNLQTLICVRSKKPQSQRYCKVNMVCNKSHGKNIYVNYIHICVNCVNKGLTT